MSDHSKNNIVIKSNFVAGDLCPCLVLPESFTSALGQMMDMSLLKDPVFVLIGISNLFGMAGLYIPFVYLVDCAVEDVNFYLINSYKNITGSFLGHRKRKSFILGVHHWYY